MVDPMQDVMWNLISDVDYSSVIEKYRKALEEQYLKFTKDKALDINKKNAAILDIQDSLNSFKESVENLFSESSISAKDVYVSDESVLSASITDEVATGTYYVKVVKIATVDQWISSGGVYDPYDNTSNSNIVLHSGENFSFDYNGTTIDVTADGNWSLYNLISAINEKADELGLNVNASMINVGGTYKLLLTGEDTGAAFKIENIADNSVLGDADSYIHLQTAQDAKIEFGEENPVTISSSSNTIELVEGLTIELNTESPEKLTIEVRNNKEELKKKIHQFVDAYNELVDKINSYTTFDENTYETGPLFGESYVADLKAALVDLVLTDVYVDATFYEDWGGDDDLQELHNLSQLGIDFDSEGHLEVQDYKLDWYLENHFDAVKKLFTAEGGLIDKVTEKIGRITDPTTGFIAIILNAYQSKLDLYKSQYDKTQEEIDKKIEKMQQEFLQLEQIKSQMKQMQQMLKSYFSQDKD